MCQPDPQDYQSPVDIRYTDGAYQSGPALPAGVYGKPLGDPTRYYHDPTADLEEDRGFDPLTRPIR
jgi:hypothetical protein